MRELNEDVLFGMVIGAIIITLIFVIVSLFIEIPLFCGASL